MELYQRDFLLSRIICGYLRYKQDNLLLRIYYPSKDLIYEANEVYNEAYHKALEDEIMTDDDVFKFLKELKKWTDKDEHNLKEVLPKHIDYWKEKVYENFLMSKRKQDMKKYLTVAEEEYNRLLTLRHSFDHYTCAGLANYSKWQFIIENSTYKNKEVYNWSEIDCFTILNYYNSNLISEKNMRHLAKNEPWNGIWNAGKKNGGQIFERVGSELTQDQQRLISWSALYDAVNESMDCPIKSIIDDDDALDGWLIKKRKERDKEGNKNLVESKITNRKIAESEEIFVAADTVDDAAMIDAVNNMQTQRVKRQRLEHIKKQGRVLEHEFADVKQKRAIQAAQAFSNKVKGK